MKTKHLFFATALVASFASCTNDDIVEVQQGVANANRPTVDNVQLNFVGEGVDSRLTFGSKGYAWEASDVIGALLMDQPTGTTNKKATWNEKYNLTNWVNTSYPFSYNADTKVWSNDAKMLEGNYFFAFPFSSYNGGREVLHSLKGQTQTGVASKAVAESYAKNQFFVGYSQIFGGTEAEDALENVEMTSILGGIQFRIINNGSKTYHINKLVVSGSGVSTELKLTPAMGEGAADDFNYAMYVGDKKSSLYDADAAEAEDFDRAELLRNLIAVDEDGAAQLKVEGTKSERAIAKGATGYAVVMINPIAEVDDLTLDIYTDEGVISGISLTSPITDVKASNYEGILVDKAVEEVAHDVANTIIVKFTDEAVGSILSSTINDENDLLQLIEWNVNSDIKVTATATLAEDVELTKEMIDLLKSNKNVTLAIDGEGELTLAEDLAADVLEYEGLEIAKEVEIVVAGEIELTDETPDFNQMTIAEGAVLNANAKDINYPALIINEGTVNFGEETIASINLTNEETGVINVAKGADVKGTDKANFKNNGTINNNGYVEHITNNADAVIVLGEKATLKDLVNEEDATVITAKDSQVTGTNEAYGLIHYVTGATINVTNNGMVSAEAPASVAKNAYKDTNINTLILKAGEVTTFADATTGGITTVIVSKGSTLKVANKVALSLVNLIVEENATIITNTVAGENASSLTVANVIVGEDIELTNNGNLTVTTSWENEGIVYNNGTTMLPLGYTAANWGVFKYTAPNATQPTPADQVKAAALQEAITETINKDGYDALTLAGLNGHIAGHMSANEATYKKVAAYGIAYGANVTEAEYKAAVKAIKNANTAALKAALVAEDVTITLANNKTLYQPVYKADGVTVEKSAKTVAYDDFRSKTISIFDGYATLDNVVKYAFDALTDAQVDEILAAKAPAAYIWEGCNLQKAIKVWKKYNGIALSGNAAQDYAEAMKSDVIVIRFVEWAKAAMKDTTVAAELTTAGVTISTLPVFSKYTNDQFKSADN